MRQKYNAIFSNTFNMELGYIQKYLGPEFETVLNPEANDIHDVGFDSLYVPMQSYEDKLSPFKSYMDSDRCLFLTGLTGCGKSSLLSHIFHINNHSIIIDNRSLYISFSFDHAIAARDKSHIESYFTNQVKTACEIIKAELIKMNLQTSNHDLYEYIKRVRHDSLQHGKDEESLEDNRLKSLMEADPIAYYALVLKYYLTVLKEINNVVLIVDDIESVGHLLELVPIDIGLSLWSCFKRQPNDAPKVWRSSVIISCRHYVYRMIQKHSIESTYIIESGIDSQTLESYPIDNEINIAEPVKLIDIVRKRVEALDKKGDGKRWKDALAVVEYMLTTVDNTFGDFVTAICINNIRKALDVLKKVILNKRWIQRNWQGEDQVPGAFTINSIKQFNMSPPCLLRAIALGEGNTYADHSIIPNILNNDQDENSDLITLIVLKSFMSKSSEKAIDWRISLDRYKIVEEIKQVLINEDAHPSIDCAVEHLILNRLLLRSKNQSQDDGLDIQSSNIADIKKVYVSRSAFALWNQLGRSSVLLELFTDDIFIDYESNPVEKHNFTLFDARAFQTCIEFVSKMVELEKKFRFDAKNKGLSEKMNDLLGSEFITKQLLNGLVLSRDAYYKTTDDYHKELDIIAVRIDDYKNQISSI